MLRELGEDVHNGVKGLKIYKNLGLRVVDREGKRVPIDDSRLDPLWAKCGALGIPVLIHSGDPEPFWQPLNYQNERLLELYINPDRKRSDTNPVSWDTIMQEQLNVFKKHPETQFIFLS